MEQAIKFDESVILVDVAFLNCVIEDLRKNFSRILQRELKVIDLSELISYIALDAGLIPKPENKIQVLLIYDDLSVKISHSEPSDLENELNDVAFQNELGEFSFYSFCPEGFVTKEELYLESLKIILSEKEVKRLWLVTDFAEKGGELQATLSEQNTEKQLVTFCMSEPSWSGPTWQLLGYPVMQALGIRSEELN